MGIFLIFLREKRDEKAADEGIQAVPAIAPGWREWGPFQELQDVELGMQSRELGWGFPGRTHGKGGKESDREIGRI